MVESLYEHPVLCRPARPADRAAVMAITADIWDGEDYVPHVWDHWFWQDIGLLAVAERDGQVVGQGHMLDMGLGEWWLRGLRVDPRLQGNGIGAHLHHYFVDQWLRRDGDVVRLATHAHQTAVHRMCDQTGFSRVATFVLAAADPEDSGDPSLLEPVESMSADEISERLNVSPLTKSFAGLMDLGWRFALVRPERLRAEARLHLLCHTPTDSLLLIRPGGQAQRQAQLLAVEAGMSDLRSVLTSARLWAAVQDFEDITWLAPSEGAFTELAEAAGFEIERDDTLHIYERRR
ncbi:MAG: GNAT family N-acetyltransferase [Anaerolineales bacterium]